MTTSDGGGWNRTMALFQAVRTYHELSDEAARQYLEAYLARQRRSAGDSRYLDYLDRYIARFELGDAIWFESQKRVAHDLGSGVELGGRVERLDLLPAGGHAAWLFQVLPRPRRWQSQLRMPLLQRAIADSLGAQVESISVGLYWFDPDEYSSKTFSDREVREAVREGRSLAARIAELTD